MTKAVIFDFDGVIHDTFEFHRQNLELFSNQTISPDEFRQHFYGNVFKSEASFSANVHWEGYADFIHDRFSGLKTDSHIKSTIEKLSQQFSLFVISSAEDIHLHAYFRNNNLHHHFVSLLGCRTHVSKVEKFKSILEKHTLLPDECVFVTDTLGDILEAREVAVKTVAVDFWYHDAKLLQQGNPHAIISKFDHILQHVL